MAEDPPASEVIYLHKYFQIFNYFISQDSKNVGLSCCNTRRVQGPGLIGVDALRVLSVGDVVLSMPIGEDNAKWGHVPAAPPPTQDATLCDLQLADYFWCVCAFCFCMRSLDRDGHVQVNCVMHLNGKDEHEHLEWFDCMPSSTTSLTHVSFSSCRSATHCHLLSSVAPCPLQTSPHMLT